MAESNIQRLLGVKQDRHITCGIELELLLTPNLAKLQRDFDSKIYQEFDGLNRPGKRLSRFEAVAAILQQAIDKPWFKSLGYDPNDDNVTLASDYAKAKKAGTLYQYWTVTNDLSLEKAPGQIALEIVSRVFKPTFSVNDGSGSAARWSEELDMVWEVLYRYFQVETNSSCGTHVHFKIFHDDHKANPTFSMPDIQSLSKAIAYWGPLVDQSVPAERTKLGNRETYLRDNLTHYLGHDYPWCPAIIADYQIACKSDPPEYKQIFSKIDSKMTTDYTYIKDHTRQWTPAELQEADGSIIQYMGGPEKYMAWNYLNLTNSPRRERPDIPSLGTIEFRLPPGSKFGFDAEHWICFLLTFAALSFHSDTTQIPSDRTNLKSRFADFRTFMQKINKETLIEGILNMEAYENVAMK